VSRRALAISRSTMSAFENSSLGTGRGDAADLKWSSGHTLAVWLVIAFCVLTFVNKVSLTWAEPSSGLLASLFGLPLLLQTIVLVYLDRRRDAPVLALFYAWMTVLLFGGHLWLWMFYPSGASWERWPIPFAGALVLVAVAVFMACVSHYTADDRSRIWQLRL